MANVNKTLGKYRDWPQLEAISVAAVTGGSAADPAQDAVICHLPDLTRAFLASSLNNGLSGSNPNNRMWVRELTFTSGASANTVGGATHNVTLFANLYRLGVLQGILASYPLTVNTTITPAITGSTAAQTVAFASATGVVAGLALGVGTGATFEIVYVQSVSGSNVTAVFLNSHLAGAAATSILVPFEPVAFLPAFGPATTTSSSTVASGSHAMTPASMLGIHVGDSLLVDTVASTVQETVVVTAVTNTTFTATFANAHSGSNYPVVTALDVFGKPLLANGPRCEIRPHDVITYNRVSNDTTGIATPVGLLQIEWVPSTIGQ
jgi:hypothetical protein